MFWHILESTYVFNSALERLTCGEYSEPGLNTNQLHDRQSFRHALWSVALTKDTCSVRTVPQFKRLFLLLSSHGASDVIRRVQCIIYPQQQDVFRKMCLESLIYYNVPNLVGLSVF
jgi:hypothetical protein